MRFELPALKIRPLAREMERGKYACEFRVSSQNLASVFACIGIINPFNRNWVRNRDSAPSLARLMAAANVQGEQKRSSHHPNRIHPHPTNSKLRTPSIKRNSGRWMDWWMDGVNVGRMEIRKEIFGFARRVIPFFRTSVASCVVCPANLVPNRVLATNDDKDATGIFRYILFFYQIRKIRILFVEKVYITVRQKLDFQIFVAPRSGRWGRSWRLRRTDE